MSACTARGINWLSCHGVTGLHSLLFPAHRVSLSDVASEPRIAGRTGIGGDPDSAALVDAREAEAAGVSGPATDPAAEETELATDAVASFLAAVVASDGVTAEKSGGSGC